MSAIAHYFLSVMANENAEIARGLRRRDPDLLDQLIAKYQHRLLRYLISLTANRDIAEDFFQETWMRVLERGRQYDGCHEFGTWLFAIARNLVIDHFRRTRTVSLEGMQGAHDDAAFEIPATGQPSAFDATVQREQSDKISLGMQQIPTDYRECLVLRFQEGMSLEEISRVTGAPLGTVKSRIYRGLAALEPWMKGERL